MPRGGLKYGEWKIFKLQQKPQSNPAGNKIFSHPSPIGPCEQNSATQTFSSVAISAIGALFIQTLLFLFFWKESNADVTDNSLTVAFAKIELEKQWDDAEIYYTSTEGVAGRVTRFELLRTSGLSMHVVPKQACYPFSKPLPYCQTTPWTVQSK